MARNWFQLALPTGWDDVLVRAMKVMAVAFVVLVLKEWMETREFDFPTCAIDGAWVAGGTLVANVLLQLSRRQRG